MRLYLVILCSFFIVGLADTQKTHPVPYQTKTYTFNLDLPPKQMWAQLITDNKENIHRLLKYIKSFMPAFIFELTPVSWIRKYNPRVAEEVQAIAELAQVNVDDVFWLNMMYELATFCTSIIIQDENNNIFHGRNLDWGLQNYLEPLLYNGDFYRNGKLLFRANVVAGAIGFLTAEKPGAFAISINQRNDRDVNLHPDRHPIKDFWGLMKNFYQIFENHRTGVMWNARLVLENATTFEEAFNQLASTPIIAPVYYILSGVKPNQGVVLEMDRDSVFGVAQLDADNGIWYLVQTNYDRDLVDPKNDRRRIPAEERIDAIGRENITPQNLVSNVLSLDPNLNKQTLETIIMSAQGDYLNTTCWRWENSQYSILTL